jgi:hypothetical protein
MIAPYLLYREMHQFVPLQRCIKRNRSRSESAYYRCFILDHQVQDLSVRPPAN